MAQILGVVLLAFGLHVLLDTSIPLLVAGALLIVVPEIASAVRRGDKEAKR
jgi:hypothetical protein